MSTEPTFNTFNAGPKLRVWRKRIGFRHTEVEEMLGWKTDTLAAFEANKANPSPSDFGGLARVYNCTVTELFGPPPPRMSKKNKMRAKILSEIRLVRQRLDVIEQQIK